MRYLLDTNIVSDLIRNPQGRAACRAKAEGDAVCTSIIVASELRYGCARKGSLCLSLRVEQFLAELPVLAFDLPADTKYGALRAQLESNGRPIGPNDMLIGAHALALGVTLVTANTSEFQRIENLTVENWL